MRLTEIYIANFGRLSDYKIPLSGGANSFLWDNGDGKTTLCEFISAMFYGMSTSRSGEKGLSRRTHYCPFGGGKFGGTLLFTDTDGDGRERSYRLERTFSEKSFTGDTVKLFVDGEETQIDDAPGVVLFGVGQDTFEKLLYLNSDNMSPGANAEITEKIGNFAGIAGAGDKALADLLSEKKALDPKRNQKVNPGVIPVLRTEIDEKEMELRAIESKAASLPGKYGEREEIIASIGDCEKKLKELEVRRNLCEKWDHYEEMKAGLDGTKKNLDGVLASYPNGLPGGEPIEKLRRAALAVNSKREYLKKVGLTEDEAARLSEMEAFCGAGKDTELGADDGFGVDFGLLEEKVAEFEKADSEAVSAETRVDAALDLFGRDELTSRFSGREDEAGAALSDVSFKNSVYNELRDKRDEKAEKLAGKEGKGRTPATYFPGIVMFVLAVLVLGAGAVLFFVLHLVDIYIAISIGAAGVAFVLAGVILLAAAYRNKIRVAMLEKELGEAELTLEEAKTALYSRLSEFGGDYCFDNGPAIFERDLAKYTQNSNEIKKSRENADEKRAVSDALEDSLRGFFALYGIGGSDSPRMCLEKLKTVKAELGALRQKKSVEEATEREISEAMSDVKEFADAFVPGRDPEELLKDPDSPSRDVTRAGDLTLTLLKETDRIEGYRTGIGISARPEPVSEEEIAAANTRLKMAGDRLRNLEIDIEHTEDEAERAAEVRASAEELKGKLEEKSLLYTELELAEKLIKKAANGLRERYIGPVMKRFEFYKAILLEKFDIDVNLRNDFTVEFEDGGAMKSQGFLSAGQLSCVGLCVKLALAEGVFGGSSECFFVMDDPFLTLDKGNMDSVRKLIASIEKKNQIIYLTCHESRTL